jgi:hypothetical protein
VPKSDSSGKENSESLSNKPPTKTTKKPKATKKAGGAHAAKITTPELNNNLGVQGAEAVTDTGLEPCKPTGANGSSLAMPTDNSGAPESSPVVAEGDTYREPSLSDATVTESDAQLLEVLPTEQETHNALRKRFLGDAASRNQDVPLPAPKKRYSVKVETLNPSEVMPNMETDAPRQMS